MPAYRNVAPRNPLRIRMGHRWRRPDWRTAEASRSTALPGGQGLVQTVDFFTPIVDDPFDWGRIAAANAFSDVYAMGGRPALALNLVAWPVKELPLDMLARVLEGGARVAGEAGVVILG